MCGLVSPTRSRACFQITITFLLLCLTSIPAIHVAQDHEDDYMKYHGTKTVPGAPPMFSDMAHQMSNLRMERRLNELLQSNAPPSAAERKFMENYLQNHPHRLLDTGGESAPGREDDVNYRQAWACRRILSPVRRLPPHLVKEILLHAQPVCMLPICFSADGPDESCSQVFAAVCAAWRTVALGTPQLWSEYSISLKEARAAAVFDAMALEWVGRASNIPIAVDLCPPADDRPPAPRHARILSAFLARCRSVRLQVPDGPCGLQYQLPGTFRGLKRLDVDFDYTGDTSRQFQALTMFSDAPRLRELSIRFDLLQGMNTDVPEHINMVPIAHAPLPWHQLVSLDLCYDYLEHEDALRILNLCTSLLDCEITVAGPTVIVPTSTNNSLRTLRVIGSSGRGATAGLLRVLALPALTELNVSLDDTTDIEEQWSAAAFYTFVVQSRASLTSLILGWGIALGPTDIIAVLACTPTLTLLHLQNAVLSHASLIRALAPPEMGGHNNLLPRLKDFLIGSVDDEFSSLEQLLAFFKSHWPRCSEDAPGALLARTVCVQLGTSFGRRYAEDFYRGSISVLRNEGLDSYIGMFLDEEDSDVSMD